jgi:hypothetical protein
LAKFVEQTPTEYLFRRITLGLQSFALKHVLEVPALADEVAFQVKLNVLRNVTGVHPVGHIRVPASTWDAIKQHRPFRWLFKPRYITHDVTYETVHLCPHLRDAPMHDHVRFLLGPQEADWLAS